MKWLKKTLQVIEPRKNSSKYGGLSDFMRRAPHEEKIKVFKQVAQKANEDQLETFRRANVGS